MHVFYSFTYNANVIISMYKHELYGMYNISWGLHCNMSGFYWEVYMRGVYTVYSICNVYTLYVEFDRDKVFHGPDIYVGCFHREVAFYKMAQYSIWNVKFAPQIV